MTVIAIATMRDEADVAGYVVRHMLDECDGVIVFDHGSTDGTSEILRSIVHPRLTVAPLRTPGFDHARILATLVGMAQGLGATWIVPFDADEWWSAHGGRIADVLEALPDHFDFAIARQWTMVPQPGDLEYENPFSRITSYRYAPEVKVAFRPGHRRRLAAGSHSVSGVRLPASDLLWIRHYPYRTPEQAMRKVRQGKAALETAGEVPENGAHWRALGELDDTLFGLWWEQFTQPIGLRRLP